VCYFIY